MEFGQEVSQFSSITGLDAEQSRFFVESAGGDLQTALTTFYEAVGDTNPRAPTPGDGAGPPAVASTTRTPAPPTTGPQTLGGKPAEALPEAWRRGGTTGESAGNSGRSTPRTGTTGLGDLRHPSGSTRSGLGRIATLSDVGGGPSGGLPPFGGDGDPDEEDTDPGPTEGAPDLYAGGGTSGLNVQDPSRQGSNKPKGVVSDILRKASEAGPSPFGQSGAPVPSGPRPFGGTAHTLGSDDVASRVVPDPNVRSASSAQFPTALPVPGRFEDEDEEEDEEVERHLTFWKDGFSIEDGPLLRYDDPKNKDILDAINAGRAPLDLLNVKFDQRVTMRVQKRLHEDYIPPPKKPAAPFSGVGNRLGSPMPAGMEGAPPLAAVSPPSAGGGGPVAGPGGRARFEVNPNLPVASVQIRLGDGSRMVTRFNHTHTVGDIREQIQASHPTLAARRYVLQTTFPSRELTNEAQTIKDAGLAGSVVVQRFV